MIPRVLRRDKSARLSAPPLPKINSFDSSQKGPMSYALADEQDRQDLKETKR